MRIENVPFATTDWALLPASEIRGESGTARERTIEAGNLRARQRGRIDKGAGRVVRAAAAAVSAVGIGGKTRDSRGSAEMDGERKRIFLVGTALARPAQRHEPMMLDGCREDRQLTPPSDEPGHLGREVVFPLAKRQRGHCVPHIAAGARRLRDSAGRIGVIAGILKRRTRTRQCAGRNCVNR